MKKIFWLIQQAHKVGGAEIVTVNLCNKLVEYYDITLVIISDYEKLLFKIDPRIKIVNLKIPQKYIYIDEYIAKNIKKFHIFRIIITVFALFFFWLFKKYKYRKILKSMTTKDDLIIASAMDSYLLAPRGRNVYFHFHFNKRFFNKIYHRFGLLMCRRPDKWIFLTEKTHCKMPKRIRKKSVFIYNPIRIEPKLTEDSKTTNLLFLSRFVNQKKPFRALLVAKKLKEKKFPFTLRFYGDGILEKKIAQKIKEWNLDDCVYLCGRTDIVEKAFDEADLLLVTSAFEGLPLAVIEANSRSVPVITTNWGDSCDEIIKDGINGYICDKEELLARKIIELFNDRNKLNALRKTTFAFSKTFSWNEIIKKWQNII